MLIPDHETEVDFLNCEAISRTVVQLLKDSRKRALTIGIHGDWGAGKSSVLKMIECDLSKDHAHGIALLGPFHAGEQMPGTCANRLFAELQRICAQPCRCHADFFILHGHVIQSPKFSEKH